MSTPTPEAPVIPDDSLDFSDDGEGRALGQPPVDEVPQEPREPLDDLGLTGAATQTDSAHEDNVTLDDLSPDTLFDESGARSPIEPGGDGPADEELRTVDESEIGGGIGLDEAELGHSAPLDGKPWTDEVSPTDKERKR